MNKQLVNRKLRKLITNPKQFFTDAKLVKKITGSRTQLLPSKISTDSVNNVVLGHISSDGSNSVFLSINNSLKPVNYDFSSVLIKTRKSTNVKNEPIYSSILSNEKGFVGFKSNNFALLDVSDRALTSYLELSLIQSSPWNSSPLGNFKNVFIVDPCNNIPLFLKSTSPCLNIHCIFTENSKIDDIERCKKWSDKLDICILHNKHQIKFDDAKKIYTFGSTSQLIDAIHNIVLIHGAKPYDLLVPCFGSVPYLDNIDHLNDSDCDVYIKISGDISFSNGRKSFSDLVKKISDCCDYILCRESIMQRYDNVIEQGDIDSFISEVSFEGFRLEIDNK